ncbi:MAG: hypothetical protein [Circular genetic element sp.]|nr:MAG: hypothetical protein [Circular genetic element sp.]
MSHKGADIGEFLHHHGLLPVQLEPDADVVESFLPAAFVEEIDAVEDKYDDWAKPPKKKQKLHQFQKPKTTSSSQSQTTMRRRPVKKYTKTLRRKVNKLACCVDTETHMHDRNLAKSAQPTNTLTTFDITGVPQGDAITNRTGNKINIRGVAVSMDFNGITGPLEVFLIRPSNTNSGPSATDFSYTGGPGKMLQPGKGWTIRKYTIDPVYKKSLDVFIPVRLSTYYDGTASGAVSNKLYMCIYNDSGTDQTYTGISRIFFSG